MDTAKAVVARSYGGPESLEVVEMPVPQPGPGEVLLEVRAAGVNPADMKMYGGVWGTDEDRLPMPLGFEASGVITQLGEGVEGLSVGDEVIAWPIAGGYASDVVVRPEALTPKPGPLGWNEAAGLMLTGAAAWHALEAAGVSAGETVLVHGASGGVGLMAVQLARLRDARVIGTASLANHGLLRELGAEPVEYGAGLLDRVRALDVDACVDFAGTDEALEVSLALVAPDRIATIANFSPAAFDAGVKVLGAGGDPGDDIRAAARPELARLAGTGALRVLVGEALPLEKAAEAHRILKAGKVTGKLVLLS